MRTIHSTAVRTACFALGAALVAPQALAASADYFLKIEGVDGESKDARHKGEVEILSYSWGATRHADALTDGLMILRNTNPDAARSAGAAGPRQTVDMAGTTPAGKYGAVSGMHRDDSVATLKRNYAPVKFTKPLETGSISLNMKLANCAVGTRYPSAELTTLEWRYALQDVVVASCGAEPRGSAPTEQVTLNYTKVEVRGWDPKKKEE